MNWSELEQIWRSQTPAAARAVVPDLPALEARQRQLARTLWWRDWLEAVSSLAVAGIFTVVAVWVGLPTLPVALSVGLLVLLAGFFISERLRAGRQRPQADAPVCERIRAEIRLVRRQRRMLRGVVWWYLLPIAGAVALFATAVVMVTPPAVKPNLLSSLLWFGLVYAGFCGFVWWLNQRTIARDLQPRLQELELTERAFSQS